MKREDKIKITKDKIIESALHEFNIYDYEQASMNHICSMGDISKGIIYHYFKDKDELYLTCIKICFDTMLSKLKKHEIHGLKAMDEVKAYMEFRIAFFKEYPQLRGIFFHSIIKAPNHLVNEIELIKEDFNLMNRLFYSDMLTHLKLRDGVPVKEALKYFEIMQHMFNDYFRQQVEIGESFDELIEKHERLMLKWIEFMIFGIAKENV